MAEPAIPEKVTSSNQRARELKMARELEKEREASLKTIDAIMEVGKLELGYKKRSEAQEIKVKDCSDSIELQTHPVALGYSHTSIRITPKGEEYKNDPRFQQVDEAGRNYTTLGAGPVKNRLTADVDRSNDIGPHPNRIPIGLKNCENESMLIEHILDKFRKFKSNTDYDLFPKNFRNQVWYWPDDGHNSNSFISGLIDASHLDKPSIDVAVHPGWEKPVPIEYFRSIQDSRYKLNFEGYDEFIEKIVFDDLYLNDNGKIRNTSNIDKYVMENLEMDECKELSDGAETCPQQPSSKPFSKYYDDYKKRMADKKYWDEAVERHHECIKSGAGEICSQFLEPRDVYESKRSEAIKEVFNKIDDFKKSDAFKFIENQVDGVTKILPKI
ncbi:MAG: hypothetical protein K1X66_00595 [Verrucomicrobiae bacterium]|nr:hypothetical protein [Verrucomicrobiae bacterium]